MIWAPILAAVFLCDLLSVALLAAAAWAGVGILSGWDPADSGAGQLEREVAAQTAEIRFRWGVRFFWLATIALVWAVATVLPQAVPGAMCGTGVMEAMEGRGGPAVGLRLLAAGLACGALFMMKINAGHPRAPATEPAFRLVLLALPAGIVSAVATAGAVSAMDARQPVDCCAVVYSRAAGAGPAAFTVPGGWLVAAWLIVTVVLTAGVVRLHYRRPTAVAAGWLAAVVGLWCIAGGWTLVQVLSAYHFEVLHHHCPWCFFLPDHGYVGFALFGLLAAGGLDGCRLLTGALAWRKFPAASPLRAAAMRAGVAAVLFLPLAGGPALLWRLRFGVWMGG